MDSSPFSFSFEAIGTIWFIEIFDKKVDKSIQNIVIKTISEFETNYSRFKSDSLISKLNTQRHLKDVSTELFSIINFGERLRKLTDNNFSLGVGSILEKRGYDSNYSFSSKESNKVDRNTNMFKTLSKDTLELHELVKIDIGGIGKGWIVDKVANLIKQMGFVGFFINAGGDIYATQQNQQGFTFILENPLNTNQKIGEITIENSAIASSSSNRRSWVDKNTGKRNTHIVGENEDIAGVFTQAPKTLHADATATCLLVTPPELWSNLRKKLQTEFLIVFKDGGYVKTENYKGKLHKL